MTRMLDLSAHAERVFCEICLRDVLKSEASLCETRDHVIYLCGADCYEKWMSANRPATYAPSGPEPEIQTGHGRSTARDDRLKHALKQHPGRDEPRIDDPED